MLVKVDKFTFSVDFVVSYMEEDREMPLILCRPFLATCRALIDVHNSNLTLRVNDEEVRFNIYHTMKFPTEGQLCNRISVVNECFKGVIDGVLMDDPLEHYLVHSSFRKTKLSGSDIEFSKVDVEDEQIECRLALDSSPSVSDKEEKLEVTILVCEVSKSANETISRPLKVCFLGQPIRVSSDHLFCSESGRRG